MPQEVHVPRVFEVTGKLSRDPDTAAKERQAAQKYRIGFHTNVGLASAKKAFHRQRQNRTKP